MSKSELRVTSLAYGDRWAAVSSNLKGIQSQAILREEGAFPIDKIKKWMDEGKRITQVRLSPPLPLFSFSGSSSALAQSSTSPFAGFFPTPISSAIVHYIYNCIYLLPFFTAPFSVEARARTFHR